MATSADGLTIVVGAPGGGNYSPDGGVYIFERTSRTAAPSQTLISYPGSATWQFGASVDISAAGDRVIVGMPFYATNIISFEGNAFIIDKGAGWSPNAPLFDTSTLITGYYGGFGYFGWAVAISDDGNT